MEAIDKMMVRLDNLTAERDGLQRKLKASLALQRFMPDAFDHGACKVGGRSNEYRPHLGTVTFTLGNGDVREMAAMKVPFHLWPKGMQLAFESLPKNQREVISRKMMP